MTLFYVDVSHYDWDRNNGKIDWAKLHQGGMDIMIARATYGDPSVYAPATRNFKELVAGAKANGFSLTGGYHNLIRGGTDSIARQVDFFRKELDAADADWAMVDVEPYQALINNNLWPTWESVLSFAARWKQVEKDRKLTFYIARWVWESWLGRVSMVDLPGALISARYAMGTKQGSPTELYSQSLGDNGTGWQPYGGIVPSVWQFTSNGVVPGKIDPTDINAFKGTLAQFEDMVLMPEPVTPKPDVLPTFKNGARTLSLKTPHMRGTDVLYVQKFIGTNKVGALDGDFGAGTKAGVIWYQGQQGLLKDGEVGVKTWARLLSKPKR